MKKYFSFIYGTCFIPSSIPFDQTFPMIYGRFLILYPGLFHSSMAGISFNISFLCGKFFIHSFIFTLGYFIQYFIPHGRFFIHLFHPCLGLFHSIFHSTWQVFHSFISTLPWDISFYVSGFS